MRSIGDVYFLQNNERRLMLNGAWQVTSKGGMGLPNIQWETKGGSDVGQRVVGYRVNPRVVSLQVHHNGVQDISTYRTMRANIMDMLDPQKSDPCQLYAHLKSGAQRYLNVRYDGGLNFNQADHSNSFNIFETITLRAHDPMWYDPTNQSVTFTPSEEGALYVPFEVPFQVGGQGVSFTSSELNYDGQLLFRAYPTITLEGSYTYAKITNDYTGAFIRLNNPIAVGKQRIITLGENFRSIVDTDGVNRFSELSDDSSIIDFFIVPNVDSQTITLTFSGITVGSTGGALTFNKRYIAI